METLRNNAANNSADGDGAGGGAGGKLASAFNKALGSRSGRAASTAGAAAESAAATESGGANGSTPDTPVFKVPGRASTVPIGPNLDTHHAGSIISQNRSKMQVRACAGGRAVAVAARGGGG